MEEKRQSRRGPWVLLLIATAVSALVYAEISYGIISEAFNGSEKVLMPEGIVFEHAAEWRPVFSRGESGFLRVTKDGASYYSYKGDFLWNKTFSLQSPYVLRNGSFWAVLEPGGRNVYVFGQTGPVYEVSTEFPILSAYLNDIPCLMLILQSGESSTIRLYNAKGEISLERKSELEGVYPVCGAMTDDGMMFAVGYVDTSKAVLSSRVLYFYTDSGAARYGTDAQVSFKAMEKPNSIIASLYFSKDNRLAGITDGELFVTSAKGEDIFAYEFQNQLADYSFEESSLGIVLGAPMTNASAPLSEGSALVFDYNGEKTAEFLENTDSISIEGDFVLRKGGGSYALTDLEGAGFWTYGASDDIITIIPIDKSRALIARTGAAEIHSLKTPPKGGAPDDN